MMIKAGFLAVTLSLIAASLSSAQQPKESLEAFCYQTFNDTGLCPKETCLLGCKEGFIKDGCEVVCLEKPCIEIDAPNCPEDRGCQLVTGCDEEEACYFSPRHEEPACGELSYSGNKECCEGFIKRCGVEFFDGTCDMVGLDILYRLPICIPCGNGTCNQFENHCNCPEDCPMRR